MKKNNYKTFLIIAAVLLALVALFAFVANALSAFEDEYQKLTAPHTHEWDYVNYKVKSQANCLTPEIREYTCLKCDGVGESIGSLKGNHVFNGQDKCTLCGVENTCTHPNHEGGATYGPNPTDVPCYEYIYYVCLDCGKSYGYNYFFNHIDRNNDSICDTCNISIGD